MPESSTAGCRDLVGPIRLRDSYDAQEEVHANLSRDKNLCAAQLLLGHTALESTVRYLGVEVDDALDVAEQTEL